MDYLIPERFVLIDYLHTVYKCMVIPPMSATVMIDGQPAQVDTTIPSTTIKGVYRYGGFGDYRTAVCLEGGNSARKEYFANVNEVMGVETKGAKKGKKGYKGNRTGLPYKLVNGTNLAIDLMARGGISCYRLEGLEADDCIYSLVLKIKKEFPDMPIDIITGDHDMLPLVDDMVSVYMRGNRTYAEDGCPERDKYFQVTPNSWDDFFEYSSKYKNFYIPYNSVLLYKIIRGDDSDDIPMAVKGYGAKKYSELVDELVDDEVDFETIFRYGVDFDSVIKPVLVHYFSEEDLAKMKYVYEGINLKNFDKFKLPSYVDVCKLQPALTPFKINLPGTK